MHKESITFVVRVFYFSFHSFSFISTIRTRLLVLQRCAILMPFQELGRTFKHTCTYRDSMLLLNIGILLISPLSFYFVMKGRETNLKMPDNKLENKKNRLKDDQTEILKVCLINSMHVGTTSTGSIPFYFTYSIIEQKNCMSKQRKWLYQRAEESLSVNE